MWRALAVALALALAGGVWLRARHPASEPAEAFHTRHLNPDGTPKFTNRLAGESSPYLRQHAHNPVDWYPWGEEAFAKARRERKPILLSIGYSTCHWCHVMAAESFEDEEIATELNARYVAVKVDREERPDVDAVYMAAVERMTQGGAGWPMTIWLTPERRPFYAATYLPPRGGARGLGTGFLELLQKLADVWTTRPDDAEAAAAEIVADLAPPTPAGDAPLPDATTLSRAATELAAEFDAEHGGLGLRPKFPRPAALRLLLREHRRTGAPAPRAIVVRTLEAIAAGGIHDQLGGGFHRYATDVAWRVPHFEKMLYDNAELVTAYVETFALTGRRDFADVARDTLAYLVRDMQAPGGGFYGASDAESGGTEGAYFLWTASEATDVLGPDRGRLAVAWFDLGDEPQTLATPEPLDAVAARLGLASEDVARELPAIRDELLAARARRLAPAIDRKVVVSWNGLAISAFARAALALRDPALVAPAVAAADAILGARDGARLPRYLLDGRAHGDGYLDDYAFLVAGLLDLYEASGQARWLAEAVALQRVQDARFADPAGGYFLTAADDEALIARAKPDWDGAEPTGNSVALENLLRLAAFTSDDAYRARADGLARAFAPTLARAPAALPALLCGVDFALAPVQEIVVVTPDGGAGAGPFLDRLAATFHPHHVLAVVPDGGATRALAALAPIVADKTPRDGRTTAWVCERGACGLPTTDPDAFVRSLSAGSAAARS